MRSRPTVTMLLVIALLRTSLATPALGQESYSLAPLPSIKEQISLYGQGADVKLTLASGKQMRGIVSALEEQTFALQEKGRASSAISYDQVSEVRLAKRKYRATGPPDATEARRAVMALGVGQHVMVQMGREKEFHGNIQLIDHEQFTLLPDRQTTSLEIPYTQVTHVEENLSLAAKIGIAAAVVLGTIGIIVLVLASSD